MKNKLGTERRELGFYNTKGLWGTLQRSAKQHGYNSSLKVIGYTFRKLLEWFYHILGQKLPFTGLRVRLHRMRGVNIGKSVLIGYNCYLDEVFPDYITIEDNCGLSGNIMIITHNEPTKAYEGLFESYVDKVIIKKYSWISVNTTIMPGVTIGPYSIVSPGSVVTKDIPPYTVARGNPAVVIGKLPKGIIEKNIATFTNENC